MLRLAGALLWFIASVFPAAAQDPTASAEWQQQATEKITQGDALYQEGRYYEAADAYGWVANDDMWYLHAGPRQIMALVRAGLADPEASEALAAATAAFRTLEGFPLPDDLQTEYESIDQALQQHAAGSSEPAQAEEPALPEPAAEVGDEPAAETPLEETVEETATEPASPPELGDDDELVIDEQIVTTETIVPSEEQSQELAAVPPVAALTPTPVPEIAEPEAALVDTEPSEPEPEIPVPTPSPTATPAAPSPTAIPTPRSRPGVAEGDILSLANVTTAPRLTRSVPPEYPTQARRLRISGEAKVSVLVGVDGSAERVRFLSVPREGLGFEAAVERAVGRWRFIPATKDGVVVRTWVPIRIPFNLVR